ncbi:MAG: hypothetical protein R3B72_14945 [Polyangiaceae bacterium]
MRLSSTALMIASVAALTACGDNPDPNDPSNFNQGYGYPQPTGAYPQPGAAPTTGYPQPTATAPAPAPTAAGGSSATPVPPAAAAMAQPILTGLAQSEVAGMSPDGASFAGQFQQGQTLEQPFQIQPGRCYSVVAVGIGITELDVQIVLHQPPLPPYVAAQDQGTGPQAVLGGKGQCFKNPLPVGGPAKVVMTATGGAGLAMGQIYSK